MNDKWLVHNCNKFARKYFGNDLPEIRLKWRKPFVEGHGAEFFEHDGNKYITLNPVLRKIKSEKYALICLLHEMCHAKLSSHPNPKVRKGHGKLFNQEMKRLANAGAFNGLW